MMLCKALSEINEVARSLCEMAKGDTIVLLKGDLAAGKTTLVKAVVKELGFTQSVTSPTFSLQQVYGESIYHYDIYNFGLDKFIALGLLEELEKEGLHLIEWADEKLEKILVDAGFNVIVVEIEKKETLRCYRMENA